MRKFWIYVLESLYDGSHYIGHTENINQRLIRHNEGDYRYTKGRRPWKVIYFEEVASRSKAIQRERFLKSGIGRQELSVLLTRKSSDALLCNGSTPPFGGESLGSNPSGAE